MFIELIDLLRCPRTHDESWLVAAFTRMDGRFVMEGKLGCPVCSASYPIAGGIADLRKEGNVSVPREQRVTMDSPTFDAVEESVRYAAMLGLTRAGSLIVLDGASGVYAPSLCEMTESRAVVINPDASPGENEHVGIVLADVAIPLAAGSVDGIVLGAGNTLAHDVSRVLRQGGRLVADNGFEPGESFRELARDDRNVVAESLGQLVRLNTLRR